MAAIHTGPEATVPEALTEEHHDWFRASWELPTRVPEAPPTARPTRSLVVGILAASVSLAVGFGAGYWAHTQMIETTAPYVISRVAGPVDANGAPLVRRVPLFETQSPNEVHGRVGTDARGMTLGSRVPPVDDLAPTRAQVTAADPVAFGRHGGRP